MGSGVIFVDIAVIRACSSLLRADTEMPVLTKPKKKLIIEFQLQILASH